MKQISLGSPANTVFYTSFNFICNMVPAPIRKGGGKGSFGGGGVKVVWGKISTVHLHDAFVWQRRGRKKEPRIYFVISRMESPDNVLLPLQGME